MEFHVCTNPNCGLISDSRIVKCATQKGEKAGCGGTSFRSLENEDTDDGGEKLYLARENPTGHVILARASGIFN